jgi:hypothetical protein
MGVITKPQWETDASEPGGVRLVTVPDPDRYGLAVSIENVSELTTTDWSVFYNGTLVIDETNNVLYRVRNGALAALNVLIVSEGSP